MASGKAGGMKNSEPLKADGNGHPLQVCLPPGARPGSKDLLRKNHEAASISWTGRANRSNRR
jgi:hypothetical protein